MTYLDDLNSLKEYLATGPGLSLDSQADAVILLYRVLQGLDKLDDLSNLSNIYGLLTTINTNVSNLANANSLEDIKLALLEAISQISPARRVYVSALGDDQNSGNQFYPVASLTKAIEKAQSITPAASLDEPIEIHIAPGTYLINAPLVLPRNISLTADTQNTVYIKPTVDTENNNLLLVDSNSTINNINFTGHQNGAFAIALNENANNISIGGAGTTLGAYITRPVLVTNCTSITSSAGIVVEGLVVNTELSGGSIEIDGNKCANTSPSKTIIVSNFTSINYNGLGFLVKNSGQGHFDKCVSSYCQYHLKCESGGLAFTTSNINNYGNQGLVATGYNTIKEGEGRIDGLSTQQTITISNLSEGAKVYKGSLLKVGDNVYKITSFDSTSGVATLDRNLVESLTVSTGTFHKVSKIIATNHFFNHIGSGVDYSALADNNTLDVPENKIVEDNEGFIVYTCTDSEGNISLNNFITIDATTGAVIIENKNVFGLEDLEANFRLNEDNEITQNITNTPDGVVPKPFSFNPYNFTKQQIELLANRIDGGSTYQIFVDIDNPNASDSKHNRGNTRQRPFRTLERALIETARRSFSKGSNNDIYNRVSIYVAPGIYRLNNGRGGVTDNEFYHRYQDAANLILKNLDNIADAAYGSITFNSDDGETLRTALYSTIYSAINFLADDLSSLGNKQIVSFARSFVQTNAPDPGTVGYTQATYLIPFYYNLILDNNGALRNNSLLSGLINALYSIRDNAILAMRNQGVVTDLSVIIDSSTTIPEDLESCAADPQCANVECSIRTLIDILVKALNPSIVADNPYNININVGSMLRDFPEEGEPSDAILQSFNDPIVPGIILPRGVSIIGADLRKVIFKPKYVPSPTESSVSRGSIFRMTGGNFFQGFTVLDQDPIDRGYANATSHHKLTAFTFATLTDLELYYNTVSLAFSDRSIYNKAQDASNLLEANFDWLIKRLPIPIEPEPNKKRYKEIFIAQLPYFIQSLILDLKQLGKTNTQKYAKKFLNLHIKSLEPQLKTSAVEFYNNQIEHTFNYLIQAINNLANETDGGIRDYRITFDNSPSGQCSDVVSAIRNYLDIMKAIISEQIEPDIIDDRFILADSEAMDKETNIVIPHNATGSIADTVQGASPYIFSASVRSEYGMCGIEGDGSLVSGLKSYLAAQFTIISLQKDNDAFRPDLTEVRLERYKGSRLSDFSEPNPADWRHFGYKVSNGAYAQLVSCFCICPAVHYWATNGSEFSITNSTSNFGDISLYSEGYNPVPYKQDTDAELYKLIKPANVNYIAQKDSAYADIFNLGSISDVEPVLGSNFHKITLSSIAKHIAPNQYTLNNPNKLNYVYVSSTTDIPRRAIVQSLSIVNGKTELIVQLDRGIWNTVLDHDNDPLTNPPDAPVIGKQLYIKRFVDTRPDLDRQYRILVRRPIQPNTNGDLYGKRKPLVHYVIQKHLETSQEPQPFKVEYGEYDKIFYILSINSLKEDNEFITIDASKEEVYDIQIASLYTNALGDIQYDLDLSINSRLDLDYDPDDPLLINALNKATFSKHNIEEFITLLGISSIDLNISETRVIDLATLNIKLDFNKPSIIRCGGQTWEYMGYYNYSSGLPNLQTRKVGEGLPSNQQKLLQVAKTQTGILGGRIYATGMDEEGNSYIGNRIVDLKTGEQLEVLRGSSQEVLEQLEDIDWKTSYTELTITTLYNTDIQSTGTITANIIDAESIDVKSIEADNLAVSLTGVFTAPYATEDKSGIVKIATNDELDDKGNNEAVITPSKLNRWRVVNKILSNKIESTTIYVSSRPYHSAATSYRATSPNHGDAVTWSQFENNQNGDDETLFWQLNDPALPNFRCLSSMAEVVNFGNANLGSNDQVVLIIDPGKYRADYIYNFGLVINGANNKGMDGWGNPDGSDITQDGQQGGVIFYATTTVSTPNNNNNVCTVPWTSMTFNSEAPTRINYVHFWTATTALKDSNLIWGDKKEDQTTFDEYFTNIETERFTNPPRSRYNLFIPISTINLKTLIYLKGSGDKIFTGCTFGGFGDITPISSERLLQGYMHIETSCKLILNRIVLRGNEVIRVSDKFGRLVKQNGSDVYKPANSDHTTWEFSDIYDTNNNIITNSISSWISSSYIYHDPTEDGEFVRFGFSDYFISAAKDVTVDLIFGGETNEDSRHRSEWGYTNYLGTLSSYTVTSTANHDLRNIRLETNHGKLFGTDDSRLYNEGVSLSSDNAGSRYLYKGTDTLGRKTDDLYPPNTEVSMTALEKMAFKTWTNKLINQGPILHSFIATNTSINIYLSDNNWRLSPLVESAGFLGEFGYKPLINNFKLQPIDTTSLSSSYFGKTVQWTTGGSGCTLTYLPMSTYNLFTPAWKGFIEGRYHHPVIVDVDNQFSTILTNLENTQNYDSIANIILDDDHILDGKIVGARFTLVGTTTSQYISLIYSGYTLDNSQNKKHKFLRINDNSDVATYIAVKTEHNSPSDPPTLRIFNTIQLLLNANLDVAIGTVVYVKSSNLFLKRTLNNNVNSGANKLSGWAANVSTTLPKYAVLHNLANMGLFGSLYKRGIYINKLGLEANSLTDFNNLSSLPVYPNLVSGTYSTTKFEGFEVITPSNEDLLF